MGYDFWGESVAFLGVEITKGSFQAALQRFAAAGNQLPVVGPLPLLEIVARRVAAALEADPFALPGRHRLPPDLQKLVCRGIFRFGRLPGAAPPPAPELAGPAEAEADPGAASAEPPAKKHKASEQEQEQEQEQEGKEEEEDDDEYWDTCYRPNFSGSRKGVELRVALIHAANKALRAPMPRKPLSVGGATKADAQIIKPGAAAKPRLSMWHRSADDSCAGFGKEGPLLLRIVPNLFSYRLHAPRRCNESDFMAEHPLHQPTLAERLLLVDAVRLLGVEPLEGQPRIQLAKHTQGG